MKPILKFSADSANAFSFYEVFLWTASSPECPVGYCIVYLLKSTLKNRKKLEIFTFLQKEVNLECKNLACSHLPMPTLLVV